jgi:HlyD family secretion protein
LKKYLITGVIILVLIGLIIFGYVNKKKQNVSQGRPGGGQQQSIPVNVAPVSNADIAQKVLITGTVNARADVEIYPKQSGEIMKMLVDIGDKVKAGQVLADIDSKSFEIQSRQAEADLAGAKAAYDKNSSTAFVNSETDFKQAKSNLDRVSSALKQAELDLQLQVKQADSQIKKANADLRVAQAKLDVALSGARGQELEQAKVRTENAKNNLDRLIPLAKDGMVAQDQVESAQLQYDIYSSQLSLLQEGVRPEDKEALQAQVESSKSSLESAQDNKMLIDIKKASFDAARAQLDNAQALFDQANVSKDASTWQKDLAQTNAAVKKAEASLELAKQRLDEATIKAPINGTIAQRFMDKGDYASPSRPFVKIVDIDVVKIIAKVPERDVGSIKIGQKAIIKPDAYPGKEFSGIVRKLSPIIDRDSQTCDIEIEAQNPDQKLKPGMFVRVELTISESKVAPVVSKEAILIDGNDSFVYVADNDKAVKKMVTTGISDGVKTEIVSGLNAGDNIIITGLSSLNDGASISISGKGKDKSNGDSKPKQAGDKGAGK